MKTFTCLKCYHTVSFATIAKDTVYTCGNCGNLQYTAIFPAILQEAEKGKAAEKLLLDEHATCFFHKDKVASVVCDECGVFLCTLCDLHFDGTHFCPQCLKRQKKQIKSIQNRTLLYDEIMLLIALLPLFMIYITIITAPIAIIGSIYFWNKIKTPYKRGKIRFIIAIIIGLIEIACWVALLFAVIL